MRRFAAFCSVLRRFAAFCGKLATTAGAPQKSHNIERSTKPQTTTARTTAIVTFFPPSLGIVVGAFTGARGGGTAAHSRIAAGG